jgi:hypothetical protein
MIFMCHGGGAGGFVLQRLALSERLCVFQPKCTGQSAAPDRPSFRRQSRPLSDDLLHGLPPTSSVSTARAGHTGSSTCGFRLAEAHSATFRQCTPTAGSSHSAVS